MHYSLFKFLLLSIIACCISCTQHEEAQTPTAVAGFNMSVKSEQAAFTVTFASKDHQKLPIGEFHQWIITVKDNAGKAVYPAKFAIGGGMPAHGHGLPTAPTISEYLGDGQYLMEGVKFSMDGHWEIQLRIMTPETQDTAKIAFDVHY